jgi:hypothetical protein
LYYLPGSSDVNRRPIDEKRKCVDAFRISIETYWISTNAIIHKAISGNAGH